MENRKSRASVIFLSLGGTPVDGEYEPEKYGVPQIDNVDLDVLGLFTSRTDKACLGDLINSKCFIGEAEELVEEFLSSTSKNTNINMCHFDNLVKLISLDNDCMFYFIFDVI